MSWPGARDNLTSMESWRRADVPVLPGSGPAPRLHDTATGELVLAAAGPSATLYACGITPYDATHMGHAATYTAWDLLVRAWLDARFTVSYVQNVTDVDDPLLERADRDGEDWRELARREIQRYRGALYNVDEDVYFARSADQRFGALSGPGTASGYDLAAMAELSAERGGDPDRSGKKDPLDVLVWRAERLGEPAWDSRFGRGRPGWHVECAAIATEYLGTAFDVQAGGSDLVFPHHEMSASHARVALLAPGGTPPPNPPAADAFARVYAHAGLVSYQGEKMSKSLGNLVFVSRLVADGTDPMAIRMALLAHHYRSEWEWTDAVLAGAQARPDRWRAALGRAEAALPGSSSAGTPSNEAELVLSGVRARMNDDLDAPGALAVVDRWADSLLAVPPAAITPADADGARLVRDTVDALLGITL